MDGTDRYTSSTAGPSSTSRPRGRGFNLMMSNFISDPHANHETKRNHVNRLRNQIQASVDVYDMDTDIMPMNDDVFMDDGSFGYGGPIYTNMPLDSGSYGGDSIEQSPFPQSSPKHQSDQRMLQRQNEVSNYYFQTEFFNTPPKGLLISQKDSANYSIESHEDACYPSASGGTGLPQQANNNSATRNSRYLTVNNSQNKRRENYSVDSGMINRISNESYESFQSFPSIPSTTGNQMMGGNQESDDREKLPPVGRQRKFPTLQRTSSYELATGKLEPPDLFGSNPWKNALLLLKKKNKKPTPTNTNYKTNKRDSFLNKSKQKSATPELIDPVYHLLKCAASQNHMPTTCRCPCHLKDIPNSLYSTGNYQSSPSLGESAIDSQQPPKSPNRQSLNNTKSETSMKSMLLRRLSSRRRNSEKSKSRNNSRTRNSKREPS